MTICSTDRWVTTKVIIKLVATKIWLVPLICTYYVSGNVAVIVLKNGRVYKEMAKLPESRQLHNK